MHRYNVHVEVDGKKSGTFYLDITSDSEDTVRTLAEWYADILFPDSDNDVYYIREVNSADPNPTDFTLEFEED